MKRSLKHDHEALLALRSETRRLLWQVRFFKLVVVMACGGTLDLLARWHAPELRAAVIEAAERQRGGCGVFEPVWEPGTGEQPTKTHNA
jgi:hypothetical protein